MKKLITILTITLLMSGCEETTTVEKEGCQYYKTISFGGQSYTVNYTHKGNCNNPIHFKNDTL